MKLILITGGSKGLGKSLVEQYLEDGFEVVEFSRSGQSKSHVSCDFSQPEGAAAIMEKKISTLAQQKYSEVILINNVSTLDPIGPIADFSPAEWLNHINISFSSVVVTSGIFMKHFQSHDCK
ncbi:MAG: short-chain dehydrogenase, partial [SAR324 cluster bacterium]